MTYCNEGIHNTLKEMGHVICDFCDEKIDSCLKIDEFCCENKRLMCYDEMNVCINCGTFYSHNFTPTYVDFHENKYRMKRGQSYSKYYK